MAVVKEGFDPFAMPNLHYTPTTKESIAINENSGPAIIIAYSPCIAHGINMMESQEEERLAVESGYWPLYRYNPVLLAEGKNPFQWDSKPPKVAFRDFILRERRYTSLRQTAPEDAERLWQEAEEDAKRRFSLHENMLKMFGNDDQ
jgi:pyruvate-ferredoxin/flavodoxin oxidoreductase